MEQSGQGASSPAPAAALQQLTFEPGLPVTGDALKAVIPANGQASPRSQFFYTWKINGRVVQESWENALEVAFKRGDIIEVEAASRDAFSAGSPPRSHSVIVGNAPPRLRLSEQSMDEKGVYRARLEASDPENDSIAFSLMSGPPGMKVDPKTGEVLGAAEPGKSSSFAVNVAARDAVGAETVLGYQVRTQWPERNGGENHASSKSSAK
ncbi:MAG: hypothetical protein MUF52_13340 [Syntrophobacteraceae bacterium]|jgi:hypothetical protein|nr:hypothetical protein [Syntrophobacteraceae bacterium]